MERISIFNYEAFYLDYLEGNLSEEDTALLLEFLRQHPELELMDDELPTLTNETIQLTSQEKTDLKIISDDEVITVTNIDHFLIAEQEGVLSDLKKSELEKFMVLNPQFEKDRELYGVVRFNREEKMVYGDKAGLKQDRKIGFWPYIAGIAAAGLIAFVLIYNGNSSEENLLAEDDQEVVDQAPKTQESDEEETKPTNRIFNVPSQLAVNGDSKNERPIQTKKSTSSQKKKRRDDLQILELKRKTARNLLSSVDGSQLEPISGSIQNEVATSDNSQVTAYLGVDEMKDPIKPVTDQIKKRVKADVDFRTAKATKEKQGGFYLKIGKLEIIRKTKKKN